MLAERLPDIDAPRELLTPEEYLASENDGETRHEYVDGEVFAMTGASRTHALIASNLLLSVGPQLAPGCQTVLNDLKVEITTNTGIRYYYPDLMVSCDQEDDPYINRHPLLIAEILSPSTQRADLTEKRHAYQQLPSLQVYLAIEQELRRIRYWQRRNAWKLEVAYMGELHFDPPGLTLDVEALYAGTPLAVVAPDTTN